MQTALFFLLGWIGVGVVVALWQSASIGAAKQMQLEDWLAIRRKEWRKAA
jgi:hypothetical protein